MVEGSKKDARYFQNYAKIYLRDKDFDKAAKSYEHAGDYWDKKGEIRNAIKDYEDALRYAPTKEDQKRIKEKMEELHFERGKILGRLGQIKKGLEDKLFVFITSISLLFLSLFFSLFSLTGNSISILSQEDFRWIGLCLFVCGLILSFFYLKKRK